MLSRKYLGDCLAGVLEGALKTPQMCFSASLSECLKEDLERYHGDTLEGSLGVFFSI